MGVNDGPQMGVAHVKGVVNGKGMNDDIVDAVDSAGPGVEKAGEKHGKRYADAMDKE